VNRSKFEAVLESIVRYATDTSDATVEKVAFSVLNKMVMVWSPPITAESSGGSDILASGFHDAFAQFVVEHLSRVCFEVPSKSTFNSNDAQSRLVIPSSAFITIGFG
jgi:exportin-T